MWVSLVSLLGFLILAIAALRAHRLDARRAVVYVLAWGAIFLAVAAAFGALA
ncbi:hypothetical protein GRI75_14050 [Altererythrobacter soli]|uniref:Uncharacterized protein n=1 Tax=Croceibacterium soli TaxID=1739690 RepID=A0A6I4V198_9SPHN|nr:hypothetical protein [Croceibacterium soli]MXP42765.1 hypothetical protein [Croceibacterium soli]